MERESLEDEEYFENEDEEEKVTKQESTLTDNKMQDENSPIAEKSAKVTDSNNLFLSEEQLKLSQDSLLRMKNKIASKKLEAEEDNKFVFGNKAKIKPNVNKTMGGIKIQLDLSTMRDEQTKGNQNSNGKRPGEDLTSNKEIAESGVDLQKKVKL